MSIEMIIFIQYLIYFLFGAILCYGCNVYLNVKNAWYTKPYTMMMIIAYPFLNIMIQSTHSYFELLVLGEFFGILCCEGHYYQRLFIPLMLQELLYSVYLLYFMTSLYMVTNYQNADSVLYIFLLISVYIFIFLIIRKHKRSISNMKKGEWKTFFIIALFYQFFINLYGIAFVKNDMQASFGLLILLFIMLSFYMLFLFSFVKIIKEKNTEFENQVQEFSTLLEKQLKDTYEENRKIRHDLKNHMMMIQYYLKEQEYDEALKYLMQMENKIQDDNIVFTKNKTLNYILNIKSSLIRSKKIKMKISIYDDLIFLHPFDITTIFGNLLDNAIAGCLYTKESWIHVLINKQADHVIIEISNSYDKSTIHENQHIIQSSKEGHNHGIGISSVTRCVTRNSGTCAYHYDDTTFTFSIDFPQNGSKSA